METEKQNKRYYRKNYVKKRVLGHNDHVTLIKLT